MCTVVTLPDGTWLHTVRELADIGIVVGPHRKVLTQGLDDCLCGVDVEGVLADHRLRWRSDTGGGFLDLEEMPG